MGFYKQEYWSGLPCPSPVLKYTYIKISIVNSSRNSAKYLYQSMLLLPLYESYLCLFTFGIFQTFCRGYSSGHEVVSHCNYFAFPWWKMRLSTIIISLVTIFISSFINHLLPSFVHFFFFFCWIFLYWFIGIFREVRLYFVPKFLYSYLYLKYLLQDVVCIFTL